MHDNSELLAHVYWLAQSGQWREALTQAQALDVRTRERLREQLLRLKQLERCPCCQGTGRSPDLDLSALETPRDCEVCQGAGLIPAPSNDITPRPTRHAS